MIFRVQPKIFREIRIYCPPHRFLFILSCKVLRKASMTGYFPTFPLFLQYKTQKLRFGGLFHAALHSYIYFLFLICGLCENVRIRRFHTSDSDIFTHNFHFIHGEMMSSRVQPKIFVLLSSSVYNLSQNSPWSQKPNENLHARSPKNKKVNTCKRI